MLMNFAKYPNTVGPLSALHNSRIFTCAFVSRRVFGYGEYYETGKMIVESEFNILSHNNDIVWRTSFRLSLKRHVI